TGVQTCALPISVHPADPQDLHGPVGVAVRQRRQPDRPVSMSEAAARGYKVELDVFEGPLALLLHLVKKHELDIFDIPISFVTTKYLEYLDLMSALSLDVAGEYLLMAATLAHIKSRELLPAPPPGTEAAAEEGDEDGNAIEDAADPRQELIRRLLEY